MKLYTNAKGLRLLSDWSSGPSRPGVETESQLQCETTLATAELQHRLVDRSPGLGLASGNCLSLYAHISIFATVIMANNMIFRNLSAKAIEFCEYHYKRLPYEG